MLIQLAQLRWCQLQLLEKLEHPGGAIVTGEVVRRSRKPRRPRAIPHSPLLRSATEICEFAEPPRHHRPQIGVLGKSQERVARPKLAALVTPADDIRPLQPFVY